MIKNDALYALHIFDDLSEHTKRPFSCLEILRLSDPDNRNSSDMSNPVIW